MQSFTHFSTHAFERVNQRTRLNVEDIAEIIDRGLVVNTGRKPGLHREHLVFYSHMDQCCFVAIRDSLTGTVITILPLDYHKNLAWEISADDCERAKEIFLCAPVISERMPTQEPKIFVISGHFINADGRQKTQVILKMPSAPYHNNLHDFLSNSDLFRDLDQLAIGKGIDPVRMFSVSIRLGNGGAPVVFDLRYVAPEPVVLR